MNFIIKIQGNDYFGGWDAITGKLKVVHEQYLAYRMRRPVAEKTLPKVFAAYGKGQIIQCD